MTKEQEQTEETSNLVRTSVSLPKYLHQWILDLVQEKKFNSQSSVMVVALSELKARMEEREEHINRAQSKKSEFGNIVEAYLESEAGQQYLKSKINNKNIKTIDLDPYPKQRYIID